MAFNYVASRSTAERLIEQFGQTAMLTKTTKEGSERSPINTGTATEITVVDLNVQQRDETGTLVGKFRRTLFVSTSAGVVPEKEDKVTMGTETHDITEVRPLSPGGTVVFWEVDLDA